MTDGSFSMLAPRGTTEEIEQGTTLMLKFDAAGLLPAVATDADTGEVLMLAWMNAEALVRTIETSRAHFYSRSRSRLWQKGEESGNVMDVVELRTDCDQDSIWLKVRVRGDGVACHTGRRTCFYRFVLPLGAKSPASPVLRSD
jgi:phosphoribosyl-AMP cyclohydrolase